MLRRLRLRKVHGRFLESCRNLKEGRIYWASTGGFYRWLAKTIVPIPLLGLHPNGIGILHALESLENKCRCEPASEAVIRNYHQMIFQSHHEHGGEYRKKEITVVGSKIPRSPAARVPALMKQLDLKLNEHQKAWDEAGSSDESAVLTLAVDMYQRIGLIHPFGDGNGRVARLGMNHLLRRYGLGYVIFPPLCEPSPLWELLQHAHAGTLEPLIDFARKCMHNA